MESNWRLSSLARVEVLIKWGSEDHLSRHGEDHMRSCGEDHVSSHGEDHLSRVEVLESSI